MKKFRQIHLWIGLLTSFLILVEAITGLIMTEPWLLGENKPPVEQQSYLEKPKAGDVLEKNAGQYRKPIEAEASKGKKIGNVNNSNNLMRFIKGLHSGRIGNTNLSILLDIAAIALIILSTTGIILSIKALKAQSIAKKRN